MIDFELTDDMRLMQSSVADFAKQTLAARAREFERARAVADDARAAAHELGLGGLVVPEALGGQGQGLTVAVLLEEELGAADAAAAFVVGTASPFLLTALELGATEGLGELASGAGALAFSEPEPCRERAGMKTTATRDGDGWVLRGEKAFVSGLSRGGPLLVVAQVDEAAGWSGLGVFVVPEGAAGLTVGARHTTLGLDAVEWRSLTLSDVRVPSDARLDAELTPAELTRRLVRAFAKHALVVAARAVGLSRTAFELAREHCDTRVAFGKPIGHFQAVAFTLADRLIDVDSARWMVWRAAASWDRGDEKAALLESARAAAHAVEAAMRAGDDCVQLHGGSGFIRDLLAEKLMRDAKMLALAGLTPELCDQLATALDLGLELDPALVLPTPDLQAIFT
jgi:alkylation response protein AidB-like acyl-CoA dehydrogenase